MKRFTLLSRKRLRRGAVVVQVAVMSTVILGMGALALDIGQMYAVRTELQAAADSAALAAAARLTGDGAESPADLARDAAQEYAEMHRVANSPISLNPSSDVEFGRSTFNNATGRFEFSPSTTNMDAVRVTVRRTGDSPNGPLPMTFANVFGVHSKDLWASATAVLIPRDIAVVIDLSGSMNDDSETQFWNRSGGGYSNLRDVWAALNGPAPSKPYIPGSELETEYADDMGPTFGHMSVWGDPLLPGSYNASSDPGLVLIQKSKTTSDPTVLANLNAVGYNTAEKSAITSNANDSNTAHWQNRCGVMLGLATWKSGKSGARFPGGGDGDNLVEDSEVTWISYPSFRVNWTWKNYVDHVQASSSFSNDGTVFRYRYGLKTFTDFLLRSRAAINQTNNLFNTPAQPLQAVRDAVKVLADTIQSLDSPDQMSLETFATTAVHEQNLDVNVQLVPTKLYQRQAGHFNSTTNIGSGIMMAISELESTRGRSAAKKVIVLMSDGVPNVSESGSSSEPGGHAWALSAADQAADKGFTIFAVSVGFGADRPLMQEIATKTGGQEFFAGGSPEEYTQQLEDIFRSLGGKRPVALIE